MAYFTILEPMSTGDVIDRAVRLYRRNFTPIISIVAVPSLLGYLVTVMLWSGLSEVMRGIESPGRAGGGLVLLVLGMMGYPVWYFVWIVTVAGLSRVIGDHLMLGQPITFRGCFKAARRRLGDITLAALLLLAMSIGIGIVVYFVFTILIFAVVLILGAISASTASSGMPAWVGGALVAIVVIAAVLGGAAVLLLVMSRVVFIPQVVMIEGQSAGSAIGRAMRLGGRNWYRVGAIVMFTYFVSLSLLGALRLPLMVGLYMAGVTFDEMLTSPTWNVIYQGFDQITNLLTLPIWVVSFTLLYFDSRVRKEAYDVELLAREVNPGFYWQAPVQQPSALPYTPPPPPVHVFTSPLGLSAIRLARPLPASAEVDSQRGKPVSPADELRRKFEQAAMALHSGSGESGDASSPASMTGIGAPEQSLDTTPSGGSSVSGSDGSGGTPAVDVGSALCKQCGAELMPAARFCMKCGRIV